MKNKKLNYFLIVVVLAVWGIAIYRVVDGLNAGDDDGATATVKTVKEPYNDFAVAKDTTRLLLNYRDPFGLVKQKDTVNSYVKRSYHKTIMTVQKQQAFNWGFIQYSGYIRNPVSKKLITLLSINGKNEMLSEGESRDQVKLLKNLKDSIKVSYNGKIKFIAIK